MLLRKYLSSLIVVNNNKELSLKAKIKSYYFSTSSSLRILHINEYFILLINTD